MAARPKIKRIVSKVPIHTYFKPQGIPMTDLEVENLTLEEMEALRLKDVENLEQEDAAKKMGISRSTFQRVIKNARLKMVRAIIEGKALKIAGGDYIPGQNIIIRKCLKGNYHYFVKKKDAGQEQDNDKISRIRCPECGERLIDFEK